MDNNIALLKLTEEILFYTDNRIAPICLPPIQSVTNKFVGAEATLTGWGKQDGIFNLFKYFKHLLKD